MYYSSNGVGGNAKAVFAAQSMIFLATSVVSVDVNVPNFVLHVLLLG